MSMVDPVVPMSILVRIQQAMNEVGTQNVGARTTGCTLKAED
jgi:hypothetical protein